jgi:uncharacterized OB-fold protein
MSLPLFPAPAAVTRARIERVISRLPEISEERLEAIEATLWEFADLRRTCNECGELYRPYVEGCPACRKRR